MRFWPKSLLGQMLLAVAAALLVAQTISAALLWRAAENRREEVALNAAAFRIVTERDRVWRRDGEGRAENRAQRGRPGGESRGDRRRRMIEDGRPEQLPRALRIEKSEASPLLSGEKRKPALEADLTSILEREGVAVSETVVLERLARTDGFVRSRPRLLRRISQPGYENIKLIIAGVRLDGEEGWKIARVVKPPPQRGAMGTILVQTLLIYVLLVGLHFLLLRRITKPLKQLTRQTESFGNGTSDLEPIEPQGPEDIRSLITAHNAMESRIAALLDEKDVMLGAIGHDLKTPLAALRVRIESVEDEAERAKMAASIEDITRSLDDILSLARIGRASAPPEKAELSALVRSVVEEFEDMGKAASLGDMPRLTQAIYVTWLRRALRNLISNALRYAGTAHISMLQEDRTIILRVEDSGPGIPETQIANMLEPFTRGEASRNRETGGAGLGLTLARAIAEQHGGELMLQNRESGGLRAEIRLPL
ncbi:ATP-binding protein [Pontixanthobacter aestiaquae]|uniref:histidine kinase n=1 Tax=Pontixanthobacter aestiaquae TaxID=1509367 RepID=A0A844Z315_9SPHN|nr:ATP-binding protein [Pontixanthobacter aestiaquae]MDN3646692.1 ATP-binding protein [Pontixanthobacter aestiaquae]MXO82325.1 HAMP domain-containing protein [Pontixanthobacter aestiaquae]